MCVDSRGSAEQLRNRGLEHVQGLNFANVVAEDLAYKAMLSAARSLVRTEYIDVTEDPTDIVDHFKTRFMDSERFFDKYARDKFGRYLMRRHADGPGRGDLDDAKARVEESLLFIEAALSEPGSRRVIGRNVE